MFNPLSQHELVMSGYESEISEEEKVRIVCDFIKSAPPGEFNEVVNDVRVLLADDRLLKERASDAFYAYSTDQFTTVKVNDETCLVTKRGAIDQAKIFLDPKNSVSFKYDFLKKEASEITPVDRNEKVESWRMPLQNEVMSYLTETYPDGVSAVYGAMEEDEICLTVCIEDHKYNPANYWNGKWRSQWTITFPPAGGFAKVAGIFRVQVHYYEDGNVQLLSNKEVNDSVNIGSAGDAATSIVDFIKKAETEYQMAINENYRAMSETTFKALRRQLPVTHSLIDWSKLHGYQVGKDMNR